MNATGDNRHRLVGFEIAALERAATLSTRELRVELDELAFRTDHGHRTPQNLRELAAAALVLARRQDSR